MKIAFVILFYTTVYTSIGGLVVLLCDWVDRQYNKSSDNSLRVIAIMAIFWPLVLSILLPIVVTSYQLERNGRGRRS